MYCTKCGAELEENVNFCKQCGEKINKTSEEKTKVTEEASKITEEAKIIKKEVKRPIMKFISSFTLSLSIFLISLGLVFVFLVEGQTKWAEEITKEMSDETWKLCQEYYEADKNNNIRKCNEIWKKLENQKDFKNILGPQIRERGQYTKSEFIENERQETIEKIENIIPINRITIICIGIITLVVYKISKKSYELAQEE